MRLGLLSVGMILLALLLWSLWRSGPLSMQAPDLSESDAVSDRVAGAAETMIREQASIVLEGGDENLTESEGLPSWTTPPDTDHELHGVVLGVNDERMPGAEIVVRRAWDRDLRVPLAGGYGGSRILGNIRSSADGEFRMRVPRGGIYDLEASHDGFASRRVLNCSAGEYVELRLHAVAVLHGRVSDELSGEAVEGVRIKLFYPGGEADFFETLTTTDGNYRLEGVAAGEWGLSLIAQNHVSIPWVQLRLEPGQTTERNFVLTSGRVIHGRVVEESTRIPIPFAELSDGWSFRRVVHADAEGRFEATGLDMDFDWSSLHVRANGFGHREFLARELELGQSLELPMLRAYSVQGRLLRSDGSAAFGARVCAFGQRNLGGVGSTSVSAAIAGEGGSFVLENVRQDLPQMLFARCEGDGSLWLRLEPPVQAGTVVDLGTLSFPVGGTVVGAVRGSEDEPHPEVSLELRGPEQTAQDLSSALARDFAESLQVLRRVLDARGRFHFADLRAGNYSLSVRRPGAPNQLVQFSLGPGQYLSLEPIDLEGGLQIEGRVQNFAGVGIAGVTVSLNPVGARGNIQELRTRTDDTGEFRFTGLAAMDYRLTLDPRTANQSSEDLLTPPERSVRAGSVDLVMTLHTAGWISGEVVAGATLEAGHCEVRALDDTGQQLADSYTDLAGRFRIRAPIRGAVRLEFWPRKLLPGGEARGIRIQATSEPAVILENVPEGASDLRIILP